MEIQKADPRARRTAFIAIGFAGAVVIVASALLAAFPGIDGSLRTTLARILIESPHLIPVAGGIAVLPVVFVSVYLFWLGVQIARTERFPLPG